MTGRELLTFFKFKADHNALEKVEDKLEGIKRRLEFLGTVEVVKGLFELGEKFAHFGEELHAASQAAGLGVEQFQKLAYSAGQAAVSQEELGTSLRVLQKHLYDARQGSEGAQKAFKAAGFDSDQVKGFKTSQDALLALSDRFKNMKDPIQKAALAQELMGRGSSKMIGYLSEGSGAIRKQMSEAERLGLVLGEGQVEALKKLENALSRVFALFKAMSATIAANIAPLMEHIIDEFMKFVMVNRELIQLNIENFLKDLAFTLGFVWEAMKYGFGILEKIASFFGMGDRVLSFVASLYGLITALKILIPLISFLGGPLTLILLAIGAIVVVVHDLWAALNGEQTWLNQFWEWAKSLTFISKIVEYISGLWDKLASAFPLITSAMKAMFNATPLGLLTKLVGFGGSKEEAGAAAAAPGDVANTSVGGQTNNDIKADIQITVPEGTPPGEVGKSVKEGINDHFGRMMRETKRSTQNPVAY